MGQSIDEVIKGLPAKRRAQIAKKSKSIVDKQMRKQEQRRVARKLALHEDKAVSKGP